jgi:exopolysaccharide biosynthesis polyprenyl glycosylphosphotransferase
MPMSESATTEEVLTPTGEVPEAALPRLRSTWARPGVVPARLVAELGRAGLVWFALAVVYASRNPVTDRAILNLTVATSIVVVTLKAASSPDVLLFGRGLSRVLGVGLGLGAVAMLNGTSVGLHLGWAWLAAAAFGVWATITIWDWCVDQLLAARKRVLFVGADGAEVLFPEDVRRCMQSGFEILGACSTSGGSEASVAPVGMDELERVVRTQRPDIVVLADQETFGDALDRLLDARTGVRVATLSRFCERVLGRVPVQAIGPAWFMCLVDLRQHVYSRPSKRVFDIVAAVVGLVLAAPLMAVMALLTRTTPGPVLVRQTRVGEGGRCFTVLKIRTMRCDAEVGGATFACDDDPRVTRVGRVLRRAHLDELPQLWNVLKGDMSMVGPRPERPEFIQMIEDSVPFWSRRLLVKPGVTGWAQILGDYASDCDGMARKLSYDLWYLRHGSVLVDLAICVETVGVQLRALLRWHSPACGQGTRGIGR